MGGTTNVVKFWIIYCAIAVHVSWGLMVLVDSTPLYTTPLNTLYEFMGVGGWRLALFLFGCAYFAIFGAMRKRQRLPENIIWFVPQQFVLVMVALGGMIAVAEGHYADGTEREKMFIAADQITVIFLTVFYIVAIWEHYLWKALPFRSRHSSSQ